MASGEERWLCRLQLLIKSTMRGHFCCINRLRQLLIKSDQFLLDCIRGISQKCTGAQRFKLFCKDILYFAFAGFIVICANLICRHRSITDNVRWIFNVFYIMNMTTVIAYGQLFLRYIFRGLEVHLRHMRR